MRDPGGLPEDEIARIAALWPGAMRAAEAAIATMPGIGILSPRRRAAAFVAVCDRLDREAAAAGLTQEQCQLALVILRLGSSRVRKAEAGFLARLGRLDGRARDALPETAKHFLVSIQRLQRPDAAAP